MNGIVKSTADDIREMRVRGAGRIARAGADALVRYAEGYTGKDLGAFLKDIREAEGVILGSRPTAVSLWNGVKATLAGVGSAASFEDARDSVIRNGRSFCESSVKAVDDIARIGSKRIRDGDTLLTHCNSTTAVRIISQAVADGKDVKVYATESRPWRQGLLTVRDLSAAGVDVTLIIDSAVRSVMDKVDRVFVGADTVTASGDLVNKVGTSQVALCAYEARTEFNVCAETYKFSPRTIAGEPVVIEERDPEEVVSAKDIPASAKVFNPVFDVTPAKYISNIITEIGVMSPGSVYGVLAARAGGSLDI